MGYRLYERPTERGLFISSLTYTKSCRKLSEDLVNKLCGIQISKFVGCSRIKAVGGKLIFL